MGASGSHRINKPNYLQSYRECLVLIVSAKLRFFQHEHEILKHLTFF